MKGNALAAGLAASTTDHASTGERAVSRRVCERLKPREHDPPRNWGLRGPGVLHPVDAGSAVRLEAATQGIPLDPKKAITQYVHAVWQREQGLPQNSVQAIVQTRDGYLWLGTQEGLVRFDGVRFTVFDKKNTPEIRHNYVWSLLEDREGRLWVGTVGGGLSRLEDGRFTAFTTEEGLSNDYVRAIHQDRDGSVWIGTDGGGLSRLESGKLSRLTTKEGLSEEGGRGGQATVVD